MKLKIDYLTKCLMLLFLVVGMSSFASAQRTVSGTITDADNGDPLIGASVAVVGTSSGTVTDIDGSYTLQLPDGATEIEVSYTGYASQRVTLGASNTLDVALSPGEILDEVVVVGYGSVKKSDLTGSVVSVGEDDFNRGLVTAPDQLLQGKAAGVQILNNSGQPGGATTVRIRGNASIRAGNQPLFVVDGVQLTGASTKPNTNSGDIGSTAPANPLNYLNPSDIESIQVLKDASATAIYGSRGANGVIIITTKKGRAGDPSIDFSTSVGFSNVLNKYDVLDGNGYRDAISQYGLGGDFGENVDAFDEILRTALVHNHNVSVNGGGSNGTYRVSLGYFDQEGIVEKNGLTRLTGNVSGSYKFMDERFGLDFNLIASETDEDGPAVSTNAGFRGSLIGNALQWNPTHALYDGNNDPIIIPDFGNFTNPVALIDAYNDNSKTVDIIASISPSFKLTDNLTYKFDYSVARGSGERRAYISSFINLQGIEGEGLGAVSQKNITNQILTHTLNYNQEISSSVSLQGVVGYEYQKRTETEILAFASGFTVEQFDYTNILQDGAAGNRAINSTAPPDVELQSYFARANFNIDDRFLISASVRADGSSKFGENNRYGVFPAISAGWNLHNDLLADGPFDRFKLTVGWGQTGNSEFDAGASQERWSFEGDGSIRLVNVANPDLTWETTTTLNVGVDFALFDYKLTGTLEYFNRKSEDLLFQRDAIPPAPATKLWVNLPGEVLNTGVELTLNGQIIDNGDFSWDLGANFSFLSNELQNYDGANLEYGQLFGQGSSGATSQRLENGQPLNAFYLDEFIEIGEDGQSVYAEGGPRYVGDPNADLIVGLTTNLNYGKWNLNMSFNGAYGHQIYNNTKMSVIPIGNLGSRNIDASLLGGANQEATSNPIAPSSRYIEDGDYMKLANATLSYNIGDIGGAIKNASLYLTGTNLFVITNYSGFDPEINTVNTDDDGLPSFGIEYIPYPSARTIILGARFSF